MAFLIFACGINVMIKEIGTAGSKNKIINFKITVK